MLAQKEEVDWGRSAACLAGHQYLALAEVLDETVASSLFVLNAVARQVMFESNEKRRRTRRRSQVQEAEGGPCWTCPWDIELCLLGLEDCIVAARKRTF